MKKNRILWALSMTAVALAGIGAVWSASAEQTGLDLARSKNCMSCHSVNNKVVGPSFKDVAKRYAGQADAESKLVTKVMKGGAGAWGMVPMPANAQVTEAEAHQLVQWVLSAK